MLLVLSLLGALIIIASFILPKRLAKPKEISELPPPSSKIQNFTDTSNWEELTNTAYKYELRYPPHLKAVAGGAEVTQTNATQVIIFPNTEDISINSPAIYINAEVKSQTAFANHSLEEIAQTNFDVNKMNTENTSRVITEIKNTIFAGEPAFTYELESKGYAGKYQEFLAYKGRNRVVEVEKTGIYYLIFSNIEPTSDQVLTTFKFSVALPQPSPSKGPEVCIQVIQAAINPQTGECKNFSTPCDVPDGWQEVKQCPSSGCPSPPECKGSLIYGDPNPGDPNQCPRYQCL